MLVYYTPNKGFIIIIIILWVLKIDNLAWWKIQI
jgi:hypothetical protein